MRQIAGIPVAGAVAVALVLLIRWQHLRVEEARREAELASLQAEQRSHSLESTEVTVTGTAVPGSLQWRMYGDDIGMGQCEGKFLLELTGGLRPAPVRVRWTRCDLLPDVLADELRRLSPVHRAPPFTLRGHWTQLDEFEALGLRLRP